jgi:MFS family permease
MSNSIAPSDPEPPEDVPAQVVIPAHTGASPVSGWMDRTFASLHIRDYRLFFSGQLISLIGTWMRMTAQGWLVYDLTGSKLLLGVVTGLGLLPLFLFSTITGAVADRVSKRKLLIGAQSAMMLVSLTIAILVATDLVRVWHLMVGSALIGTAFSIDLPTRQSYYIQLVGRKDLLNAIALNSAAFNAARILGPAVAAILIANVGIAGCYFADSLSFIAVIASLLLIRDPSQTPEPKSQSPLQILREGFTYVLETRRVRILLSLLAWSGIFGWTYVALLPAFAQDVLHLDATGYAALLSANGVGALSAALFVASRGASKNHRSQVFGGLWLFSSSIILFALMRNPILAGFFLGLAGGGMITYMSTSNSLIQLTVPDRLRGRVMGVWGLVFGGSLPLGSFLAGALAERWGVVVTMVAGSAVCLVFSVIVFLRLPRESSPLQRGP